MDDDVLWEEEGFEAADEGLINRSTPRLISRKRQHGVNVGRILPASFLKRKFADSVHWLLGVSWMRLFLFISIAFLIRHMFFTLIFFFFMPHSDYMLNPHESEFDRFLDSLWFVVMTGEDIGGYGRFATQSLAANLTVFFQLWTSNLWFACLNGIVFLKVARPSRIARTILFSSVAVVNAGEEWYDEQRHVYTRGACPSLCVRMATTRKLLSRPKAVVIMLCSEDPEGGVPRPGGPRVRRSYELNYELFHQRGQRTRDTYYSAPYMYLPLTFVINMDKGQPPALTAATPEALAESEVEIIFIVEGVDEATSATVQARWSYVADEVLWDARFKPMVSETAGRVEGRERGFDVDFSKISDIEFLQRTVIKEDTVHYAPH
eukprot:m51a1_g1609 putative k channel inward rectifier conserved region 2 domain protein (377) ;mRNA; f:196031-197631